MNMIRINPSSAANLTMGHHLLVCVGDIWRYEQKQATKRAPHGTHFWAPLQQRERERESQDFADGNCKGCKGCKGCQDSETCENSWISQNEPTGKPLLFFMKYQGDAYKFYLTPILGSSYDLNCVWVNTPKTIGLMPPFIGEPCTMPTQKWFQVSRSDLQYYLDPVKSHPSYPSCKTRRL